MKKLIYIFMAMIGIVMTGCTAESSNDINGGINTKNPDPTPDPTPTDTLSWANVKTKGFYVDPNTMMAYANIDWWCTNGGVDSCKMEPWLLDINTMDLVVYRDSYQPTSKSGITPDADRSSENEVKDKLGNLVVRHHYTQAFQFNNFNHKINGSWTTGRIFYGNGKEESYLPEDGLYYELTNISGNTVADTTHFVRNDSIFAREDVNLTYKATLKVDPSKPRTYHTYERTATVTVISFIGIVEHEEEIPTANDYIPNLEWHAEKANRFYNGSQWCDGILFSSSDKYYMLVTTFKLNHDGTKEEPQETKMYSIAKSKMGTPSSDKPYNAVMWDETKNQPIPCRLTVDGSGWNLGARYANGDAVTKHHDRNEAVISGVKNLSEKDNATPSPWIASTWTETQYNGVNYYSVAWHTTTHTLGRTIADSALKK